MESSNCYTLGILLLMVVPWQQILIKKVHLPKSRNLLSKIIMTVVVFLKENDLSNKNA